MITGFQSGAFQQSAFQVNAGVVTNAAFQGNAFQNNAFQTTAQTVARGVGSYDKARKKKYIVRKDGKLLIFQNEADAATVLSATTEPQEVEAPKVAKAPKKKQVREAEARAQEVVPIESVQQLAQQRGELEAVRRMLAAAQYAALMALVQRMQDEEDVELLLLAA